MRVIHARKRDGKVWYRVWSELVNRYVTDPVDEPEIRVIVLQVLLFRRPILDCEKDFDGCLQAAALRGTSSASSPSQGVLSPWETETN